MRITSNPFTVANAPTIHTHLKLVGMNFHSFIMCRNPIARERPSFQNIVLLLNQSEQVLLEIPEEALSSHPQAGELGAPLEAGQNMYSELQRTYL